MFNKDSKILACPTTARHEHDQSLSFNLPG